MNYAQLQGFIENAWSHDALPTLSEYIAIPVQSPAFDPDWETNGYMEGAVTLLSGWAKSYLSAIPGVTIEILKTPGVTPAILIDIPGNRSEPVIIYGHLDKQPPMEGWTNGRSAWTPKLEGDRLYGRGGADDGYALFSAAIAAMAVRTQGRSHPRCLILIEACEESGSYDLDTHVARLVERLDPPALIVALDAGVADYDNLWVTTSVRGQVAGTLRVRTLTEHIHSGDGAGVVPSPFRVARQLLSRLEDADTGEVVADFRSEIPSRRRAEAADSGQLIGDSLFAALPTAGATRLVKDDAAGLVLNRAWTPQLTVTGLDGLPVVSEASAVVWPDIRLKLSLRLPPVLDAEAAATKMKAILETDPPYGCGVSFKPEMVSQGWEAPIMDDGLATKIDDAARAAFGQAARYFGGGGGIPFLAALSQRWPETPFLVTGVLGPHSNAHGPNEFLHVPTVHRVTAVLAALLADLS